MSFTQPIINWAALTPALIVLVGAVLGVLVEALVSRPSRHFTQVLLGVAAIAGSGFALYRRWDAMPGPNQPWPPNIAPGLVEDPFAIAAQGVLLVIGFLAVLVMADRTAVGDGAFAAQSADRPGSAEEAESLHAGWTTTEVFPLALFSLGGMMLFGAVNNLIALFVILELVSLPLYIMAATARHRRLLSQEAALKYFVLGAFASAFLLMGAALLYGLSGAVDYASIAQALRGQVVGADLLALGGLALVTVGLLFKVGAVPFHAWSPDVYQGAPTPVTGFMAAGVKAAAFFALVRFHYEAAGLMGWDLAPFLWGVAIATMVLGTVAGIVQKDVKRMLAYSAIAHAGFMLIGIIAYNRVGIASLTFYALTYGVSTVGAFGLISLVRSRHEGAVGGEANDLEAFKGLGRRSPWAAGAMTVFLLSFAGIPLTAGFTAKFQLFVSGVTGGATWLVILAVACSAATAFFYMRLIVLMLFHAPKGEEVAVVDSQGMVSVAVLLAAVVTVVLGILPQAVIDLFGQTAMLLP
ncbi:NADH-quinone oxidoreductase subunit NuoN [Actinomyces slackii]|uniref:NADH-quinone oxidoreductase subunit N n=1 Tax=Actinomyces slackii TaxID=52774 RepID=A0A3S5EMD9_9ACTO|nr:NADH-quinone oxidoreductase subunit NuoN [Actinomyces slackii]VEG75935.1 NADH-quinone oxidoreductase subunit N [Actinomyces slackii]